MARLVMFTSGTMGDHLPFLALGQALQARGHDVLLVINQAMHAFAERAGLTAAALTDVERGPEEARENAWAWDHWNYPLHRAHEHPKARAQQEAPQMFVRQVQELAALLAGADLFLATAIRPHGLAAHLITGVPWVTVSVTPSSFFEPAQVAERKQAEAMDRWMYEGLRPLLDRAIREAGGKRLLPAWYRGCLWAPRVILGSSIHFSVADAAMLQPYTAVAQSGFWYWQDPLWDKWRPDPDLAEFCAREPAVLTFSSQPLEDPAAILHKHVRAAVEAGMPLLVQRGWADFSERDLPPGTPAGAIHFVDYAPHDWLFGQASLAIQHGGIGSLARALRQFCPVIIEPFGNDQFFNAQRVHELGVGVSLHPHEATAADIVEALRHARSKRTRLMARHVGRRLRDEQGVAHAADLVEAALAAPGAQGWGPSAPAGPAPDSGRRAPDEIPHMIHHTWKDDTIPPQFAEWYESWRRHHPSFDFRLWTDDDCRDLIAEHYAWFLPVYDGYSDPIKRVDAARYFILHRHGGLYVDLDYEALRPIDSLLAGRQLLLTPEPPAHLQQHHAKLFVRQMLSNALMASAPGHPFWEHLFDLLQVWRDAPGPLDATGPFLLSRAYATFRDKALVTIEAYQRLCPISSQEWWPALPQATQDLIARDAYALHHWYGSWWREPATGGGPATVQLLSQGKAPLGEQETTREALLSYSAGLAERPLISCLMVTRERPLQAQLAVHCFLKQTYDARELIIVDDGPGDTLANWVAANPDPRLRYVRLPDEGRTLGELRTLALEEARGTYITQWDDDDLSAPLRLELQMAALLLFGAQACLLARQLLWMPAIGSLGKSTYRLWEGSALLLRAAISGFPALRQGEETAVVEEVVASGRTVLLDMPELYVYVFHGGNTFDEGHWLAHRQQATVLYEGFRYQPALEEVEAWLGIRMQRLGDFLRQAASGEEAEVPVVAETAVRAAPAAAAVLTGDEPRPPDQAALPRVLILTPVKDAAAHLERYFANLRQLDYPSDLLSLAFLESDSEDGTAAKLEAALPALRERYRRVELWRRDYGLHLDMPRWEPRVQRLRRGILARSRNALMQAALADEPWVLWIDVDLLAWPQDVIQRLLAAGKRIVVANCLQAEGGEPFDLNSFKDAPGSEQLDWSPYLVDGLLQPPRGLGRLYLTDLMAHELVELDGVGGTMLLVDADLHRDGLIFPPVSYKGFIDTEGLAKMARDMGVRSWGLPHLVIRHS